MLFNLMFLEQRITVLGIFAFYVNCIVVFLFGFRCVYLYNHGMRFFLLLVLCQGGEEASSLKLTSGRECARAIFKQEGIKGFYSGLSVNLVRGVGGALLLVGYDEVKVIIESL